MNVLWDYRTGGFYVSERHAPLRYRARRFLEKRAVPALRKAGLALGAAAVAVFFALLTLLEKAGGAAEEAMVRLWSLPYREIAGRIVRETTWWARESWKALLAFVIFTIPALAVFAGAVSLSFLTVGFFLLAGKAAGSVNSKFQREERIAHGYYTQNL